jgi:hypothetical protein
MSRIEVEVFRNSGELVVTCFDQALDPTVARYRIDLELSKKMPMLSWPTLAYRRSWMARARLNRVPGSIHFDATPILTSTSDDCGGGTGAVQPNRLE